MSQTQLVTQVILLITGALCLYIALQLGKRKLSNPNERLAWTAFRIWWLALGVNIALSVIQAWIALSAIDDLTVHLSLFFGSTLTLCIALWGLLYYLIYLFSGNRFWAWVLGVFYGAVFFSVIAYIFLFLQPIGVAVEGGSATFEYATEAPNLTILIIAFFILLPQIAASLAYASLLLRLKDRVQRYRVSLVSLSILIWFSSPFIALRLGWSQMPWWSLTSRLLGLAAVLVIYWAYYPPQVIQRRFGVASI